MAIYTKTGDEGNTKVFDKKSGELRPISKSSCKIASIGAIDELNSYLGVVKSTTADKEVIKKVEEIQSNLFTINSILAGGKLNFSKLKTKKLERQIDAWEGTLPVLKNFIFYGGSPLASQVFYARALCRKAERLLVGYSKIYKVSPTIFIYINRLSDYLFMLARNINFTLKVKETAWRG